MEKKQKLSTKPGSEVQLTSPADHPAQHGASISTESSDHHAPSSRRSFPLSRKDILCHLEPPKKQRGKVAIEMSPFLTHTWELTSPVDLRRQQDLQEPLLRSRIKEFLPVKPLIDPSVLIPPYLTNTKGGWGRKKSSRASSDDESSTSFDVSWPNPSISVRLLKRSCFIYRTGVMIFTPFTWVWDMSGFSNIFKCGIINARLWWSWGKEDVSSQTHA